MDAVDHTFDLDAHPRTHNPAVAVYREALSGATPLMRAGPTTLHGQTPKVMYKVPRADSLPNGDMFMVKPYHEAVPEKASFWQTHPIQGWAEMTSQSLWHAADVGHLHQAVHVSEHDMGPGFDKHPGLVVHMAPHADWVQNMDPNEYDERMHADAFKMGIMDFLSNNLDRHTANLLVFPKGSVDEYGIPRKSKLMSIDHGRSFQYHASHKGVPAKAHNVFGDLETVPQEKRDEGNAWGKQFDNLTGYFHSRAFEKLGQAARLHGYPPFHSPDLIPAVTGWWPRVRDQVVATMASRLSGLKEPRMKEHVWNNFSERVKKLDDISSRPEWYEQHGVMQDYQVPLHVWNR
jgi:hypothetical protein